VKCDAIVKREGKPSRKTWITVSVNDEHFYGFQYDIPLWIHLLSWNPILDDDESIGRREECQFCRFWKRHYKDAEQGNCRKSPLFQVHNESDWCGEFDTKPKEQPHAQ